MIYFLITLCVAFFVFLFTGFRKFLRFLEWLLEKMQNTCAKIREAWGDIIEP